MKIAVTGATGLVGTALLDRLHSDGHEAWPVVRRAGGAANEILWDPATGKIERDKLCGMEAVVHLAGESIAEGRWTAAKKQRIRDSRVVGTELISRTLAELDPRPRTLVSASAIGYYGDRGTEACTESSPPGKGFLPDVCVAWEAATEGARRADIRVVNLRIGIVLSPQGGALSKMLLPFRLGVGGRVGSGRQYWSWISLDDLIGAILHCLQHEGLMGAVNAVAPNTVTNLEFTKTLGRVLHRPTVLPMPAFAARLALGEMADALLLASARVVPESLIVSGYAYQHSTLEAALRSMLP